MATKIFKQLKSAFTYLRYLRIQVAIKWGKLFKDSVYACDCHRFSKCNHVDGYMCNYPKCGILAEHQKRFETARAAYKEIMVEGGAGELWGDWKFYMFFVDNPDKFELTEDICSPEKRQSAIEMTKQYVAETL